jgi:tellurite methyltransferase
VFVQPTRSNLERHPRPGPAHLLDDGELPRLIAPLALEVVRLEEGWFDPHDEDARHEARLIARRPRA